MGQARDEAGNVWETDAQGNPVRLLQAASQSIPQPITIGQPNPKAAADTMRAQADAQVASATVDAEIRKANAQAAAAQAEANRLIAEAGSGGGLTAGQKKADEEFAKDYAAWTAGGGMAGLETKLRVLEEALDVLESSDTITGPAFGRLPKFMQQVINPQSQDVRADIEKSIQETLRQTLGAQFTAKEGESILARTYDPTQDEASNARRARNLIEELRTQGAAKNSAAKYFEQNGTIAGWSAASATDEPLPVGLSAASDNRGSGDGEPIEVPSDNPQAAGSGATSTSVPAPKEMQREWAAYINQNWGKLSGPDLNRFRRQLHLKYDYPYGVSDHSAFAAKANQAAAEGAAPSVVSVLPPASRELSGGEQLMNNIVSHPLGTGVASYANAAAFGLPDVLAGDGRLEAAKELNPASGVIGDIAGGITGTMAGATALGRLSTKVASPVISRALANPLTTDVAYGGIYGATQADDPLTGAGVGIASAFAGDLVGRQIGKRLPSVVGVRKPADSLSRGERAVFDAVGDIDPIAAALTRAADLNVPATIADVSGEVNSLTGAALRRSPAAAAGARDMLGRRADGQYDRLLEAIERDLGPIENVPQRSEDLITQARQQAGPLYEAAYAAPGASVFQIDDLAARPSMRKALNNAVRIAQEEGRDPAQIGFVFDDAGNATITRQPSWQTLDYVKRGLDDVLEGYRDKTTGKLALDTEGKAVSGTLRELLSRMDTANPDYAAARAAYAGPAAEREAMRRGQEAMRMSPNQLGVNVANSSPSQVEQMQMGFRSGLADAAGRYRNNSNPFAILNNPAMEQRLGTLYGDQMDMEIARLLSQRDLEAELAGSTNRLIGNSLTAERQMADEAFGQTSLAGDMMQGGVETLVTGAPVATAMRSSIGRGVGNWMRDARTLGVGRRATELADDIAPIALDPDPIASAARLRAMAEKDAADAAILEALIGATERRGANAGAGAAAVLATQGVE